MVKRLDLCGTWRVASYSGEPECPPEALARPEAVLDGIPATVPGEIHLDLMRAGVIEDPTVGLNGLAAHWVHGRYWLYRRTFEARSPGRHARAYLTFEGLDLAADVFVNGRRVGRHANAFRPCTFEVTEALAEGWNTLIVVVESGLFSAADRPSVGLGLAPYDRLTKRAWLRKTQCSFGWDGVPPLLNIGITGRVYLDYCRVMRVEEVALLPHLPPEMGEATVTARLGVVGLGVGTRAAKLELALEEAGEHAGSDVEIRPGPQALEIQLRLARPTLWWPVGAGGQGRYTARLVLRTSDAVVMAQTSRVGFRHVRLEPTGNATGVFRYGLQINGRATPLRACTVMPMDGLYTRPDPSRHEALVASAAQLGLNTVVVWGGGQYGSDALYEACDRHGMMVWQEFMFANARYPGFDPAFLTEVRLEAAHQARRLAHHPSLVAWCGNQTPVGSDAPDEIAEPDHVLFHHALPDVLRRVDGTRAYLPDRPTNGGAVLDHPAESVLGSASYLTVLGTPRRVADGVTMGRGAVPGVTETCAEQHALERRLGLPEGSMSPADLVYWSGVLLGESLERALRDARRGSRAGCAMLGQLNDPWPRPWTRAVLDAGLRRTPAFHPARRALQPVTLALVAEDHRVRLYAINGGPELRGELRLGYFGIAGGLPVDIRRTIDLGPACAQPVAELDRDVWTRLGAATHGAFAILTQHEEELARDRLFLLPWNQLHVPPASVLVTTGDERASFRCECFARGVCLDLGGELAVPDNYFDVLPGIATVLPWPASLGPPAVVRTANPGPPAGRWREP